MTDYFHLALYVLVAITCLSGFSLCIWWWKRNDWNASAMYIYFTFMLFGIGFQNAVDSHVYYDRVFTPGDGVLLYDTWVWSLRTIILLVVSVFVISHMIRRVFFSRKLTDKERTFDYQYAQAKISSDALLAKVIDGIKEFKVLNKLFEKIGRRKSKL